MKFILLVLSVLFCSCLSPEREREVKSEELVKDLPQRWLNNDKPTVFKSDWFKSFNNNELNELLALARKNNSDLYIASQKILLAEQEVILSKSALKPRAALTLSSTLDKTESLKSKNTFSSSVQASWVADVWGRYSALGDAARQEFIATEAEWRAVQLTIEQKVASSYFKLRVLDTQKQLQGKALLLSRELEDFYKKRVVAGLEDDQDLLQVNSDCLLIEANLAELEKQRTVAENELAYLVGTSPGEMAVKVGAVSEIIPGRLAGEYAANILQSRPDLIAAELRLRSLYYQKESRRMAKYPEISLVVNTSASSASFLESFSSWSSAIVPQISFPVLDPTLDIDLAKAKIQLASGQEDYRSKVRRALTDVENAFLEMAKAREIYALEKERLQKIEAIELKANMRYEEGLVSLPESVSSKVATLQQKERLAQVYEQLLLSHLNLYTAFGGSNE